jgi:hypothetical protein
MQTVPRPEPADPEVGPAPRRLAARAHLALPGVLTAIFAFRAGGFFPLVTGIAALGLCLLLVARVTVAARPFGGWSRAAAVAALAGAGFASWTLLSATWSGAPERALAEFDRALLYTAVLVIMAAFPRRGGRHDLSIVLRWVLAALTLACVAGLASRLAADVFPISSRFYAERLSFPLTYWNGMGMACALAVLLAFHAASGRAERAPVRIAATAVLPIAAATLYFTFSRGAIVACGIGLLAYVVLGASRRLLFTVAAAAVPTAVTVWAAWSAGTLSTARYFAGDGPHQGHRVALVIIAAAAAAAGLRALLTGVERRTLARPLPAFERGRVIQIAAVVVLLAASAAVIAGLPQALAREAGSFGKGGFFLETGDARDRLLQVSSNGRLELWKVSREAFAREPLHGEGAGTFRLAWEQARPYPQKVVDGHSLYFEVLGELGIVGGLLLAVLLLTPMVVAVRRLAGPERHAHAAFIAAGLALLVHAGVDWDWEMPALFIWYFGAAGVVVARAVAGAAGGGSLGRLPRVVAGLACLLLALTPALVVTSQSRLHQAIVAFHAGDCPRAVDAALGAAEVLPRAGAYEIVGYCDLRAGQDTLALKAMQTAHDRDPDNWQYLYGIAVAQAIAKRGDARATAAAALRRNPQEPLARSLARGLDTPSAAKRFKAAAEAKIPGE